MRRASAIAICLVLLIATPALAYWDVRDPDDSVGPLDISNSNGLIRKETYSTIWRVWIVRMHDQWKAHHINVGGNWVKLRIDAQGGPRAERMVLVQWDRGYGYYGSGFVNGDITDYDVKVKRPNSRTIRIAIDQNFLNYSFPQSVEWWVETQFDSGGDDCTRRHPCIDRAPNRGREKAVI